MLDVLSSDCNDERPCFARSDRRKCRILIEAGYRNGECPFCKPKQDEVAEKK